MDTIRIQELNNKIATLEKKLADQLRFTQQGMLRLLNRIKKTEERVKVHPSPDNYRETTIELRAKGRTFAKIAEIASVSVSTIKRHFAKCDTKAKVEDYKRSNGIK